MKKFETYLLHVPKRQLWMIYTMIVVALGMLSYNVSVPMMDEQESLQSSIENVERSIAKNSLNSIKKEISLRSNELVNVKQTIETQKEKITFLMSRIYQIKYAFFNEKELANSLDEILNNSISNQLKIDYIKNIEVQKEITPSLLKHKKSMEISGNGGYKETVEFINHIENLDSLLKFTTIKIESNKENVNFYLLLDFYGIGL